MQATRLSLLALALTSVFLTGRTATAAGKEDTVVSRLRADERLKQKVTLGRRDQPLGEFLDELSRTTGVPLRAGTSTLDDKVTLFARERPASEVLLSLSRHFDFQWYKYKEGYELAQDLNAKRREQQMRTDATAAQFREIQQRLDRASRLLGTPREQLATRRDEIRRALREQAADPEAARVLQQEMQAIQDALNPGAVPSLSIYRLLNPGQQQQLLAGTELRFSTEEGTLPPNIAQQIHQAADDAKQSGQVLNLRVATGGKGLGPDDDQAMPNHASASLRLGGGETGPAFMPKQPGGRGLNLSFTLSSIHGDGMDRRIRPVTWSISGQEALANRAAKGTDSDDPVLRQEVQLFKDGVPPPPANLSARRVVVALGAARPGWMPLSQVAEALHRAAGIDLLTDSYIRARVDPAALAAKMPLGKLLDILGNQINYNWEKEGSTIRLRSAVFYQDRPEEVPERLLRNWRRQLAQSGSFTLDDLGGVAAALADPQVWSLETYWYPYLETVENAVPEPPQALYQNRFHLRFWATLTPVQRSTARTEVIPVRQMSVLQRNAFVAALQSPEAAMLKFVTTAQQEPTTPAAVAAGGFTLQSGQSTMHAFTGTDGEGRRFEIRSLGDPLAGAGGAPGGAGGAPMLKLPVLPDGTQINLDKGQTTVLDAYRFHYHLSDNPRPARVASVQVPRKPSKQ